MKSVYCLLLMVLTVVLLSSVVFAGDEGIRDTCRIGNLTWTIGSEADSLFTFNLYGWTDQSNMWGASLGCRLTVDTVGLNIDRWKIHQETKNTKTFNVSLIDSLIIFGDTTEYGPNITSAFPTRSYSQLDKNSFIAAIQPGAMDHASLDLGGNVFTIGIVNVGATFMPANQANVIAVVTLKLRNPTLCPNNLKIFVDSTFFGSAGAFKFTPSAGGGFAPEFVKGEITVSNLVLDAEDAEADNPVIPKSYELSQNYPNPFNPSTTLKFYNAQRGNVNITIYNVMGQKVRTLVDGDMDIGWQEVIWNGADSRGENVSSGLYFYKMEAGDFAEIKKMLLIK